MKAVRAAMLPFAFLCVGLMRLAARFGYMIRTGNLGPTRIGHWVLNTECYLCERAAGLHPRGFDVWFGIGTPPNLYHAKMLRRCLWLDRTGFARVVALVNSLFVGWERFTAASAQLDRDIYNLLETQPPHLRLTAAEDERGYRQMERLGLPRDAKFVCLMVRDAAYLPELAYHSYRDADVDTYAEAAMALVDRGYYVFRMGQTVAKPFALEHPMVIDYAGKGMHDDFSSIWLAAHCSFAISTSTGWDALALAFRKPILYTNFVPLEYLSTFWPRSLAIWKHHLKDGKRMTPAEIYESGLGQAMTAEEFENAGVTLEDNSPAELRDAALEMAQYVEGLVWPDDQCEFWRTFPRSMSLFNNRPLHGEIRLRICDSFLNQYINIRDLDHAHMEMAENITPAQ